MVELIKTVNSETTNAYCSVYTSNRGKEFNTLEFYRSKRVKKPQYYLSVNVDDDIKKLFEIVENKEAAKKERRAARKIERNLKVGDILCSSWGYSMTIVSFYRVVKLVGKQSVKIESIPSVSVDGDGWSGHKMPVINKKGVLEEKTFRVLESNGIKINSSEYAYKWDGNPKYYNSMD